MYETAVTTIRSLLLIFPFLGFICVQTIDEDALLEKYPGLFHTWDEVSSIPVEAAEVNSILLDRYPGLFKTPEEIRILENQLKKIQGKPDTFRKPTDYHACCVSKDADCKLCSCSCSMVNQTFTALTYSTGSSTDVTFSYVQVPGFCRCFNNLSP